MAKPKITEQEILNKVKLLFDTKLTILDFNDYTTVHSQILVKCNECGIEHDKRLNSILHGHNCKFCGGSGRINARYRNTNSFTEEVSILTSNEYVLVGEFVSTREKTKFLHTKCKNIFTMRPHAFVTLGHRCPICACSPKGKTSNPVKIIIDVLDNYNIDYQLEKKFKGLKSPLKSGGLLSFDFFLPKYNLLIEYDGIQHYEASEMFGGEKSFQRQITNDEIKNKWVSNSKYSLLRIPYNYKGTRLKNKITELFCTGSTTIESIGSIIHSEEASRVGFKWIRNKEQYQ